MPRGFPTKTCSYRLTASEQAALAQFAAAVGETPQQAAHRAMVLGLLMQDVVRMGIGGHCLVPGDHGGILCLSAGRGDSAKVAATIDFWSRNGRATRV